LTLHSPARATVPVPALGIVVALAAEARPLGPAEPFGQPVPLGPGLAALPDGALLAVCGIGCAAAARSARALVAAGCRALASWGLAGGLDPSLSAGTIVLPERVLLEGAPELAVTPDWRANVLRSLASRCVAGRPGTAGGKLLTSRHAFVSAAEKQAAFRRTGAVAVDMESHAIAEIAAARGFPFLAVRAIVDTAFDEVPVALVDAADPAGHLTVGRLVIRALSEPQTIAPLLRLARRYGAARHAMRAVARTGAVSSWIERSASRS
jgi:adenosylhomocysteine nucleosidase